MKELKVTVTEVETYRGFTCMRGYSIKVNDDGFLPGMLNINYVNTEEMSVRTTVREQIANHINEYRESLKDNFDVDLLIEEVDKQVPRLQWREPFEHEKLGKPFSAGLSIEQVEAFNQKNAMGKLAGRK